MTESHVTLPSFVMRTANSEFRLRCHQIAWSEEFSGERNQPGLLLLSATASDTAIKATRACLYMPDISATFRLEGTDNCESISLSKAKIGGTNVKYTASVSKLAPGAIHLVAVARDVGLMCNLSDDHLFAELNGPRYTTPILRHWIGWIKRRMIESGGIVMCEGHQSQAGILTTTPEHLDEMVSEGVRSGFLRMVA